MFTDELQRLVLFFFSSRRRHTRLQGDWSSDVCSSDLAAGGTGGYGVGASTPFGSPSRRARRRRRPSDIAVRSGRSEERRVGKGVDLGGRRIIKKKKKRNRERSRA